MEIESEEENNTDNSNNEYELATKLKDIGFLRMPEKCICGNTRLNIQKLNSNKPSGIVYRCTNYKYKHTYNIRKNSFFEPFKRLKLNIVLETVKCMLCKQMNIEKTKIYLENTIKEKISKPSIRKIFKYVRETIKKYYEIEYVSEIFGEKNANDVFAIDESLFTHTINNQPVWVIGAINNRTKNFRLETVFNRDSEILKKFVNKYIDKGNTIVSDGWAGYSFLNNNPAYNHIVHIHGGGDFGFGITSTSYIEGLWSNIKSKIKMIYHIIPSFNFISFLRESEFRIKNNKKNYEVLLIEFFKCFDCTKNLENTIISDAHIFLHDSDFNANSSNDEDDSSSD